MSQAVKEPPVPIRLEDRESLLAWAQSRVPTLRERSARCEGLRRIPDETVEDFVAAGLPLIAQPRAFGGLELGVDVAAEVAIEVGRGCGSSAWMAAQWPGHNFIIGMFPRAAQKEYWSGSASTLSSTASALAEGGVERTPQGARVRGRWRFSSGVDAAEWVILIHPEAICLIPRTDYRIEDDWFVSGLRGTGSKSIVIEDACVPTHRIMAPPEMMEGRSPGGVTHADPFYCGIPYSLWAPALLASAVIGMAQGVVELFEERVIKRMSLQTMGPAKEQPGNQLRFAEASAEADAAKAILLSTLQSLRAWGERGGQIPILERVRSRRDTTYAVKLAVQAADRLFESGDASALYDTSPSQRLVRDIHAGALQVSLTWDEPALQYSRVRWGLPPQTRLF
jgi:3-hydroxy-9,10-secoandrosta-1,3,5(10)-triene-9,17-dione monooxygenase